MVRRIAAVAALACMVVLAAGCSGAGPQDPEELQGRLWALEQVRTDSGLADAPPDALPTLLLEEGVASGFTAVNRFEGSYSADAGSLTIRPELSAKAVGAPKLMATEAAYLAALDATRAYRVAEDALELLDAEGEVVASFVEADGAALESTEWICTGVTDGRRGLATVLSGNPITARFEGGVLTGSTGVNDYEAGYEIAGDALSFDAVTKTTENSGTKQAAAQEKVYLDALADVVRFQIAEDALTLYDGQSAPLARYEAPQ